MYSRSKFFTLHSSLFTKKYYLCSAIHTVIKEKMKKIVLTLLALSAILGITSCDNYETYADQKEKERDAISDFISYRGIRQIDENTFHLNGNKTNTATNEYVYMNNSGVYMQIVRKGSGAPLEDNKTTELYVRFVEMAIFDTTQVITNYYSPYDPDIMSVNKAGVNLTASFTYGTMLSSYGGSVPAGWMVPLNYINVGGPTADEDIAKVRLIVPHTQGHSTANGNVYPYFYEISFQKTPGL